MELNAGVARLGRLAGVQSIHRNLQREDTAVARHLSANERELYGELPANADPAGENEMEILAARDVHIHHGTPAPAASTAPTPAAPAPAATSGLSNLAKAGVATAALLGTGGIGFGAATLLNRPTVNPTPVVEQADPLQYGLDLLPPAKQQTSELSPLN